LLIIILSFFNLCYILLFIHSLSVDKFLLQLFTSLFVFLIPLVGFSVKCFFFEISIFWAKNLNLFHKLSLKLFDLFGLIFMSIFELTPSHISFIILEQIHIWPIFFCFFNYHANIYSDDSLMIYLKAFSVFSILNISKQVLFSIGLLLLLLSLRK
jgi:hypothetical protein